MAKYVLMNRRAGLYTEQEKVTSRASVAMALSAVAHATVVADHAPKDPLARRVVLLDLNESEAQQMAMTLSPDAILEAAVERHLHLRVPVELQTAAPAAALPAAHVQATYQVAIHGGGQPLVGIEVMFYVRDAFGHATTVTIVTDAAGVAGVQLAAGQQVSFVEPIPEAGYWIMFEEAPASGAVIDCTPIDPAAADGRGWWHELMGADPAAGGTQGDGVRVGVIDTGCGPHPSLAHVQLAGVFYGGVANPAGNAQDVAQHGTHTTGIVGARPTRAGDYTGYAPNAELFHARVFASETQGPSQADIVNAVDALSRDHQCDLINMSLGGGPPSAIEEDAIRDAAQRGTLCICSAGNSANAVNYPAAYPESAAISAIGLIGGAPAKTFSFNNRPKDPSRLGASNLFLATFSCFGPQITAAGPGVGIVSTVPDRGGAVGQHMEMDGTSMASPAVVGALAAILSRDAQYMALPRDISRYNRAYALLAQHAVSIGLSVQLQGRGLPVE